MNFTVWCEPPAGEREEFVEKINLACDAGISQIIACIYNTREAKYSSAIAYSSISLFEDFLLPLAKARNIEIHAWVMMMRYTAEDRDKKLGWFSVNRLGESALEKPQYVDYYKWLSPFVPEVREYLFNLISEIAKLDIAGVQLDYIRYCDRFLPPGLLHLYGLEETNTTLPQFDYGYHPIALEKFQKEHGYDPLLVDIDDPKWQMFRMNAITEIVNNCAKIVNSEGKLFSAAVFPNPINAPRSVLQDWGCWPLDAAYPMIYHKFYHQDYHWVRSEYKICRDNCSSKKVIPGIYLPDFTPKDLSSCLHELSTEGVDQVALFSLDSITQEFAKIIKDYQGIS